jgi:hypothetical protein
MAGSWTFAELQPEQLALVTEAERTLDTDIVLVYAPADWGMVDDMTVQAQGLEPVALDPVQLECLQGLERMVGGVAVAYRRRADLD